MTMRYANVGLQWIDEPNRTFSALVGIGDWSEEEEDERVFFYFADEAEFEKAKLPAGIEDFRVVQEWENA
jgi:hypothetical protein